jgi:hypothetical protein
VQSDAHPRQWRKTRHVAGVGRSPPACLPESAQADRRPRPLARRADRIARPARVRMRSRKPWVFERRRLFGWKVRLVTSGTPSSSCSPHVATMCQLFWVNPGPALRRRDPVPPRPGSRGGLGSYHYRRWRNCRPPVVINSTSVDRATDRAYAAGLTASKPAPDRCADGTAVTCGNASRERHRSSRQPGRVAPVDLWTTVESLWTTLLRCPSDLCWAAPP